MTKKQQTYIILISSSLILSILLMSYFILISKPKDICNPNIKSKTVILIDNSEPVAKQTLDEIKNKTLKFIEDNVPEGELISIFLISSISKRNLEPLFHACKPKKEANPLYEDERKIKYRYLKNFIEPLMNAFPKKLSESEESPIAQALIDLSLSDLYFRSETLTRVLIFSDLLENTPKFSMYKHCSLSFNDVIKKFRDSRIGSVERPTFYNTQFYIYRIPRTNLSREIINCRNYFWNWFFGDLRGGCKSNVCVIFDDLPG